MPTYEYRCPECGDFETFQKITDDALSTCPTCGAEVQRLVSATTFHLKGSGWYKTDYASSGAPADSETAAKPDKKDGTKTVTESSSSGGDGKKDSSSVTTKESSSTTATTSTAKKESSVSNS